MRNPHLWLAAAIGFGMAAFTLSVLCVALQESLWLDELHTSWSISGSRDLGAGDSSVGDSGLGEAALARNRWRAIASRAAAGNQTPLYFWLVGCLDQTPGQHPEWQLRFPSVLAWLMAICLCGAIVRGQAARQGTGGWLFALCVLAWIVSDRLQWFYATEARPYALVQLISLAGWYCIQSLAQPGNAPRRSFALIVLWCALATTNIHLHLTALLPVLCQWLVGGGLMWRAACSLPFSQSPHREQRVAPSPSPRQFSLGLAWAATPLVVGLACLPIFQLAFPVWQRRAQWAAFASDVSLRSATTMFPFLPILGGALCGLVVERMWERLCRCSPKVPPLQDRSSAQPRAADHIRLVWWCAVLGPWLMAWSITAVGIAPMFHRRFLIASALPLVIVGASELLRMRHTWSRSLTALAIAMALLFSQGTVSIWRQGYLVGSLRGEDWRAATQWLSARIQPDEPLLCSSGLIEANEAQLPLSAAFAEYLAFPLGGAYRVTDRMGQPVTVTPLIGDHHQWSTQLVGRLKEQVARADQAAVPGSVWLVYRGAPQRLAAKLKIFAEKLAEQQMEMQVIAPRGFGNLYVVELKAQR